MRTLSWTKKDPSAALLVKESLQTAESSLRAARLAPTLADLEASLDAGLQVLIDAHDAVQRSRRDLENEEA